MADKAVIVISSDGDDDDSTTRKRKTPVSPLPIIGSARTLRKLNQRKKKRLIKKKLKSALQQNQFPSDAEKNGKGKQLQEVNQVDAGSGTLKLDGTKSAEESTNIVLQKLLRGPRYFDPVGGNRETCWRCGDEGHKTFDCTATKRNRPCYVCAGFGHDGVKCIKGQECFNCKGLGHFAKDCPNRNEKNDHTFIMCLRCGKSGHDMWVCNSDYSHDDLKNIQCYVCKKNGHLCCVDYPNLGSRKKSCCNCGQSGHAGSECTEVDGNGRNSIFGKKEHSGRKCKILVKAKTIQKNFNDQRDYSMGSKSAPNYLIKAQGKFNTPYEEPRLGFKGSGSNVRRAPENLWSHQNRFQMSNHHAASGSSQVFYPDINNRETYALSSPPGYYLNPQNPTHMYNHFATPLGSQTHHLATNNGHFLAPPNRFQNYNSPPFLGSQPYLHTMNNQHISNLHASRQYSLSQNQVQMYNDYLSPGAQAYRPTFYPPMTGNSRYGHMG